MSFEADLKAHLVADGAITAIIGGRIFPLITPEASSYPALTYQVITGEPQNSLDGFTSNTTRMLVQIDCWARSFNAAIGLATAVGNRLATNAATFRGVLIEEPLFDEYDEDTKLYRRALQAALWYRG